jgi:hypothetical protein
MQNLGRTFPRRSAVLIEQLRPFPGKLGYVADGTETNLSLDMPAFKSGLRLADTEQINFINAGLDSAHREKALTVKPFVNDGFGKQWHGDIVP